jgi:diguanylate cyclase (GGDEF)-like protein
MLPGSWQDRLALSTQGQTPPAPLRRRLSCSLILFAIDPVRSNGRDVRPVGDRLRHSLLAAVRQALRATDCLVPYEGDTYVIVLPNTSLAGALIVAERLRTLAPQPRFSVEDLALTLSLGVATVHPQDSLETLMERSSRALEAATRQGGNQIQTEREVSAATGPARPGNEMRL